MFRAFVIMGGAGDQESISHWYTTTDVSILAILKLAIKSQVTWEIKTYVGFQRANSIYNGLQAVLMYNEMYDMYYL